MFPRRTYNEHYMVATLYGLFGGFATPPYIESESVPAPKGPGREPQLDQICEHLDVRARGNAEQLARTLRSIQRRLRVGSDNHNAWQRSDSPVLARQSHPNSPQPTTAKASPPESSRWSSPRSQISELRDQLISERFRQRPQGLINPLRRPRFSKYGDKRWRAV